MKILTGEEKQQHIKFQVQHQLDRILARRPKSLSTRNMDFEVRAALIDALNANWILATMDGERIKLAYLPTEDD